MVDGPPPTGRRSPDTRILLIAPLLAALTALSGCSSSRSTTPPTERLTPADFRSPAAAPGTPAPIPAYTPEPVRAERVQIRTITEAEARAAVGEVTVEPGPPVLEQSGPTPPQAPPLQPQDLALVDAKVGDLNGQPVLARRWLEPMGARLRAESAGKTRAEWRAEAAQSIYDRLVADLRDELYLAEARAALTPEQKAGLRVFLQRFERDVVASYGGSPTLAESGMLETQGRTLEQAKREREKATLIYEQLRSKVWDRVQVTSRDLELEYERRADEFSPPPEAVLRVIRVRTDDAGAVAAVQQRLGVEPFGHVADDESLNLQPAPERRPVPDGLAEAELFGPEPLQTAAAGLSPGEHAGPIEMGAFSYWIYLDRIEDNTRSLYEAQLELRELITAERRQDEEWRYLLRLFERAGVGGLQELTSDLVDIAEQWYYEPGTG